MATVSNAEKSTFLALNRLPVPRSFRRSASAPGFAISKTSGLGTREKRDRLSGRPCPILTGMCERNTFEQRHRADPEKTNSPRCDPRRDPHPGTEWDREVLLRVLLRVGGIRLAAQQP